MIEVIDVDEVLDDLVAQGRGAEEALVVRLSREPRLGVGELAAIGREDRSDPEPGAVSKLDVHGAGVGSQSLSCGARDPLRDAGDVEQCRERAGVAGVARERKSCGDGGRTRCAPKDAQLADDRAGPDRGHLVLAVPVVPEHGGFARGDEQERPRCLALPGKDRTRRLVDGRQHRRQRRELAFVAPDEERQT